MNRSSDSTGFWNERYRGRRIVVPRADDPCTRHALAHLGDVAGKRLLDLGCGTGDYSLFFADRGAEVTAVDRSDVAIDQLRDACEQEGATNVHPVVADAFAIDALGPFDLVFGKMILHHLEPFTDFVDVLRRCLVDDGRAFFRENNGYSTSLMWARTHLTGRYGIPKFGDDDEFPLTPAEIDMLRSAFYVEVDFAETFLAQLASQYLLRSKLMKQAARTDDYVHRRLPRVRRYSYRQNVLLVARPSG